MSPTSSSFCLLSSIIHRVLSLAIQLIVLLIVQLCDRSTGCVQLYRSVVLSGLGSEVSSLLFNVFLTIFLSFNVVFFCSV